MWKLRDEHGNEVALSEIGAIRGHFDPTGRTCIETDNYYINGDLDGRFTDYFDVAKGVTDEVASYEGDLWVSLDGPCERDDGADEKIWVWVKVVDVPVERMVDVVKAHGDFAYGNEDPEDVAEEWIDSKFSPEEADAWIGTARCFYAKAAAMLRRYKVTPAEAAIRHGDNSYSETLGYKLANRDMKIDDVLAVLYGEPTWKGYQSRSHTDAALWDAQRRGDAFYLLTTDEGHDVLIGNEKTALAMALSTVHAEELPPGWSLTKL